MNHSPITKWNQPLPEQLSRTFLIKKNNWPLRAGGKTKKKKKVLKYHKFSQKMGLFPSLIAINDLPAKECPDLQGQIPEQKEAGAWGCILLRDSLCVFSCSSWNEMDVAWDEMRQPSQNLGVSQSRARDRSLCTSRGFSGNKMLPFPTGTLVFCPKFPLLWQLGC